MAGEDSPPASLTCLADPSQRLLSGLPPALANAFATCSLLMVILATHLRKRIERAPRTVMEPYISIHFVELFEPDPFPILEENFSTGRILPRSFSINVLRLADGSSNGQNQLIFVLLRRHFERRIIGLSVSFVSSGYSGSVGTSAKLNPTPGLTNPISKTANATLNH